MHAADYLVHFSNVLMLVSYSVRDMLWLRWFAVAAALTVIPYYLVQANVLWPPVFWGSVFTVINLYQIAHIYMERRPVVLSTDEQKLYDSAFRALRPREFLSLTLAGEWKDAAAGEKVLTEGEAASRICIAIAGSVDVRRHGRHVGTLAPGQLIGTGLVLTDTPSPVDASFVAPGRYLSWPINSLRHFIEKRPDLRTTLLELANRDLAEKLERSLAAGA